MMMMVNEGEEEMMMVNEGEEEMMMMVNEGEEEMMMSSQSKQVIIPSGSAIVEEGKMYYEPETIQVNVGDTVIWTNSDITIHTVTSGSIQTGATGIFDSQIMAADETFEHTFDESGTYEYYCTLHPYMVGTVLVK